MVLSLKVNPGKVKEFDLIVKNDGKLSLKYSAKSQSVMEKIVINEVFSPKSSFIDGFEIWNRGLDADLTGWKVKWTDNTETSGEYAFDNGFILKSGETVVIMDDNNGVNSNTFYMGVNAGWSCEDGTELSISIINGDGDGVDFMRTSGNTDEPPEGAWWTGAGVPLTTDRIYRNKNEDSDKASDWTAGSGENSINEINSGQSIVEPFAAWLSMTQGETIVDVQTEKIMKLKVDAANLVKGTYYDTLVIYHNAANKKSPLIIPCKLVVKDLLFPSAESENMEINQGVSVTFQLKGTDADGTIKGWKIVNKPGHGTVTVDDNGKATFVSDPSYIGKDEFTFFVIDDDDLSSEEAKVSLTIVKGTDIIPVDQIVIGDEILVWPNPAKLLTDGYMKFILHKKNIISVEIIIYDYLGNMVDHFNDLTPSTVFSWNLTNTSGNRVAGGTYLAIIKAIDNNGNIFKQDIKLGVVSE